MNKMKKALTYVVGATVMAGVGAYMAMPKQAKESIKSMIGSKLGRTSSMDSKDSK